MLLVLLFGAGCGGGVGSSGLEPAPVATVSMEVIGAGVVASQVDGLGAVDFDPRELHTLPFPRAGQVDQVLVTPGQIVSAGATLLTVGPLPETSPELTQARLALRYAESSLERTRGLRERQLATNQELARAEEERDSARAGWESLGGGRSIGAVTAPFSGVVAALEVVPGDQVHPGESALQLVPEGGVIVRAGFEVEDVVGLNLELEAQLSPVFGEGAVSGVVRSISQRTDPITQRVEVIVEPIAAPWMIAGVAVEVRVKTREVTGPRVPVQALIERDGVVGAFRVEGGTARWTPLALGIRDACWVQVTSGLTEGDLVVTTGRSSLDDGMSVVAGAGG